MRKTFEILTLETTTRYAESVTTTCSLAIHPEHDEEFDEFVSSKGGSGFFFLDEISEATRSSGWPWAIVAFEKNYHLSGHVLNVRLSSDGVKFGAFNQDSHESDGSPAMAFIMFRSKPIAQSHKDASPLFAACWEALKDQPESRSWFCVADPLPQHWIDKVEKEDDKLFSEFISRQ